MKMNTKLMFMCAFTMMTSGGACVNNSGIQTRLTEEKYQQLIAGVQSQSYSHEDLERIAVCVTLSPRYGSNYQFTWNNRLSEVLLNSGDPEIRRLVFRYRAVLPQDYIYLAAQANDESEKYLLYMDWIDWLNNNEKGVDLNYPKSGLNAHGTEVLLHSICPVLIPIIEKYDPKSRTANLYICQGRDYYVNMEGFGSAILGDAESRRIEELPHTYRCDK